jgi:hypothetical protein
MTKKYGLTAIAGLAFMALGFTFRQNFIMLALIFIGIFDALAIFLSRNCFHCLALEAPVSRRAQ